MALDMRILVVVLVVAVVVVALAVWLLTSPAGGEGVETSTTSGSNTTSSMKTGLITITNSTTTRSTIDTRYVCSLDTILPSITLNAHRQDQDLVINVIIQIDKLVNMSVNITEITIDNIGEYQLSYPDLVDQFINTKLKQAPASYIWTITIPGEYSTLQQNWMPGTGHVITISYTLDYNGYKVSCSKTFNATVTGSG